MRARCGIHAITPHVISGETRIGNLSEPPSNSLHQPGPFGRLLRFWRATFGLSQEELALETGVSARHVSFLETGRSRPGRSMVLALGGVFRLAPQDLNTLLVAAGFAPGPLGVDMQAPEMRWLHKSLELNMRALDPWAATVQDKYGNLHLVNRGWLAMLRTLLAPEFLAPPINSYHMFFAERGLRSRLVDWEDVACRLLITLQQEVLLSGDADAARLLGQLLAYPAIPPQWARRGADIAFQNSFRLRLAMPDGGVRSYLYTVNTVGATPYVGEPRLLLSLLTPEDLRQEFTGAELLADDTLRHPLLHY